MTGVDVGVVVGVAGGELLGGERRGGAEQEQNTLSDGFVAGVHGDRRVDRGRADAADRVAVLVARRCRRRRRSRCGGDAGGGVPSTTHASSAANAGSDDLGLRAVVDLAAGAAEVDVGVASRRGRRDAVVEGAAVGVGGAGDLPGDEPLGVGLAGARGSRGQVEVGLGLELEAPGTPMSVRIGVRRRRRPTVGSSFERRRRRAAAVDQEAVEQPAVAGWMALT